MSLKLSQTFDWVAAELGRQRPVAESMAALIDQCEGAHPHPDWGKLRALPYADVEPVSAWVVHSFVEDSPDIPLRGLWFGLCNPIRGKGNTVADLRLSGAGSYDPTDCMWAVNAPWWPISRYAESAILAELYRIASRRGVPEEERKSRLGNNAEYPLCLGYGAFALREVFSRFDEADRELILGESESIGVMVGFDSGDFLHVGTLTTTGFAVSG